MDAGELPTVPVHIDSPMAVDVTDIYGRYLGSDELDDELGAGHRLFPQSVSYHRTVDESKRLNDLKGPRIIISSSGMLTGGRVLHHLRRLLPDPKNLLVLVGYQAAGTRGRALQDGAKVLKMHGEYIPVRAQFISLDTLSAHADRDDLLRWLHSAPRNPRTTFLTHGEPASAEALAGRMRSEGLNVVVPKLGEQFVFDSGSSAWRHL
jgi:metallo-beta-lactamase family protein